MPDQRQTSDLSLFVDILRTLEVINAPYVIIGAFAATVYGITRATFDIDFIVNLSERHIQALAADERLVDIEAEAMGQATAGFWEAVKKATRQEADRLTSGSEE